MKENYWFSFIFKDIGSAVEFLNLYKENNLKYNCFLNIMDIKRNKFLLVNKMKKLGMKDNKSFKIFFLNDLDHINYTQELYKSYKEDYIVKYALKPSFLLRNLKELNKDENIVLIDSYKFFNYEHLDFFRGYIRNFKFESDFAILRNDNEHNYSYFNSSLIIVKNSIISKSILSSLEMKMRFQIDQIELDFPYNILLTLYCDNFQVI